MRRMIASVVLLVMVGCVPSRRPLPMTRSISPSGRYAGALEDSQFGFAKRLVVQDQSTKQVLMDYEVERSASLLFSPSEQRAVIVDDFASNESRLFIFDLKKNYGDMVGREIGQLDPARRETMLQYSHVYFRDVRWRGDDVVTCLVDVYDPLYPNVTKSSTLSLTIAVAWANNRAPRRSVKVITPPLVTSKWAIPVFVDRREWFELGRRRTWPPPPVSSRGQLWPRLLNAEEKARCKEVALHAAESKEMWERFNVKRITNEPLKLSENGIEYYLDRNFDNVKVAIPSGGHVGWHSTFTGVTISRTTYEVIGIEESFWP